MLGLSACAALLALWPDAPEPPGSEPVVRTERSELALPAHPTARSALTEPSQSTSRVRSDRNALDALIVALGDADINVRTDAVSDLSLSTAPQAESLLAITAMQDPAPAVRVEALYALESLGAESQLAVFRHALDDPDKDVRKAAMSALEEPPDIRTAR